MMLIIILTISSTVFSQSVTDTSQLKYTLKTNKDTTTHYKSFPVPVVKKIAQDLLRYDSCKENLNKTNQELSEVYRKLKFKDSVINDMTTKQLNFIDNIKEERLKNDLSEGRVKKLEFDLGVQKVKGNLVSYLSGGFIIILTSLLIIKH